MNREKQIEIQDNITLESVKFFRENNKGLIDVTMRVGKTFIVAKILKYLFQLDSKILITYPDNRIVNSWEKLKEFGFNFENVTYSNFSSLKKHLDEEWDWFIIDEPQALSENKWELMSTISSKSMKCIALSGTVSPQLYTKFVTEGFSRIVKYTKEQAIEDGIVADYEVIVHLVNLDNTEKIYKNSKGRLQTEKEKFDAYSWVIDKNKEEGKDTKHLVLNRNRISQSSLAKSNKIKELLSNNKDKRLLVFTGLKKQASSFDLPYYYSGMKEDNLIKFNNGEFNHLIMAVAGKIGTNYKDLDGVILSNFTFNDSDNRQIIDRSAQLDYHDKCAEIHIICLNEQNEIKKIKNTLNKLDENKITWKFP